MTFVKKKPYNKMKNVKVEIDGIKFDSKKESYRYTVLKDRLEKGEISCLELQKRYELVPSVMLNGRKKPAIRYYADFFYLDIANNKTVVEDVKGVITAVYRLKKHLMKHVFDIEIVEI